MARRDLAELEELLGYTFEERALLTSAVTHRSYANEHRELGLTDNEKLEFLGDAVLDLVVGHMLMEFYPDLDEGALSVTRSRVVSERGLSEVAQAIGLGGWLLLGRGEERSGGRSKKSLLADAFEAVVAAVYLDGGFEVARALVERLFADRIEGMDVTGAHDHKTRLQEAAQALLRATPEYEVLSESGPDHAKTFEVGVKIAGELWARATGRSKKAAEQRAAAKAAALLQERDGG